MLKTVTRHVLSNQEADSKAILIRLFRTIKSSQESKETQKILSSAFKSTSRENLSNLLSEPEKIHTSVKQHDGYFFFETPSKNDLIISGLFVRPQEKNILQHMIELDEHVMEHLEYQFSDNLGFINSDLKRLGTGLEINYIIHAPLTRLQKSFTLDSKGGFCSFDWLDAFDLLVVKNRISFGFDESVLFSKVLEESNHLLDQEKALQSKLNVQDKNAIFQSLGLLQTSLTLNLKEALSLLSLLKLGMSHQLIKGSLNVDRLINATFIYDESKEKENMRRAAELNQLTKEFALA
jgi:protein-arginine kinase